jgi:hypothetical protein
MSRQRFEDEGGKPEPTENELETLRVYEELAAHHGWTDEPPWVGRMREARAEIEREEATR